MLNPLLYLQAIWQALTQIWVNKTRSMLTTLGIVIGVWAVTSVIAALSGMKTFVLTEFEAFGASNIFIHHDRPPGVDSNKYSWATIRMKIPELQAIAEHCPSIERLTPITGLGGTVEAGNESVTGVGVTGIFLGYYLPWDGYSNALFAQAHGFKTLSSTVEGSVVNYENLDNHQTGIHDYFKFLKFGFSRASDIASLHIRRDRMQREDGMELVRIHDGRFPWAYLGKPLEQILEPLEMSLDEFVEVCDRFTNKKLFKTDARGNLVKDRRGNLEKVNYDNQ